MLEASALRPHTVSSRRKAGTAGLFSLAKHKSEEKNYAQGLAMQRCSRRSVVQDGGYDKISWNLPIKKAFFYLQVSVPV